MGLQNNEFHNDESNLADENSRELNAYTLEKVISLMRSAPESSQACETTTKRMLDATSPPEALIVACANNTQPTATNGSVSRVK